MFKNIKFIACIILFIVFSVNAFAQEVVYVVEQKHPLTYLMDNYVIDIIFYGGYYSVALFSILFLLSAFIKKARIYIISFFLALFFLFLCFFVLEAILDFRLIPLESR